jgi:hypothetical protein
MEPAEPEICTISGTSTLALITNRNGIANRIVKLEELSSYSHTQMSSSCINCYDL